MAQIECILKKIKYESFRKKVERGISLIEVKLTDNIVGTTLTTNVIYLHIFDAVKFSFDVLNKDLMFNTEDYKPTFISYHGRMMVFFPKRGISA